MRNSDRLQKINCKNALFIHTNPHQIARTTGRDHQKINTQAIWIYTKENARSISIFRQIIILLHNRPET